MSAENRNPPPPSLDDLPYLDEYLNSLLRPRVERAVQAIDRSLTESVWRQVLKTIAAEQPGWTEAHVAGLRALVEGRLGLRLAGRLEWSFAKAEPEAPRVEVKPEPARAEPQAPDARPTFGRPVRPVR